MQFNLNQLYSPNLKCEIPLLTKNLRDLSTKKLRLKFAWRYLRWFLLTKRLKQDNLIRELIDPQSKKILWLNTIEHAAGDSLMHLAGRVLLKDKFKIDLLTCKSNHELYLYDEVFTDVFYDIGQVAAKDYDFIILDFMNPKALKHKAQFFPHVPFVSLRGFFYCFDYHKVLLSYLRINQCLGGVTSAEAIYQTAKQNLTWQGGEKIYDLAISIGVKELTLKTYNHYFQVVSMLLAQNPQLRIVLIGLALGDAQAQQITQAYPQNISNYVGKLTLGETVDKLAQSKSFLGVDGALMHVAIALNIPTLALFVKFQPRLYFPLAQTNIKYIYAQYKINDILVEEVLCLLKDILPRA